MLDKKLTPETELLQPFEARNGLQTNIAASMRVHRPVYRLDEFNEASDYKERHRKSVVQRISRAYRRFNCQSYLKRTIPVLDWVPQYCVQDDLFLDIISGITVAVMHIPQGLAYSTLGNVPPIFGIYMAFFPVLIYTLLGTSRHVSMGTFAVICLMSGKVIGKYSTVTSDDINSFNETSLVEASTSYSAEEVAAALTILVGIYQVLMYLLGLGAITTFLSESLVNGFTTGAAYHVLSTQISEVLGLKLPRRWGYLKLINTVMDCAKNILDVNLVAIGFAMSCMLLILLNNRFLRPFLAKYTRIPVPIELLVISMGTFVSYMLDLENQYGIRVVGTIPTGFPTPRVPDISIFPLIAIDCIAVTVVSYIVTVSMALILASKLGYEVDCNQECLALGASNVCGSFFSCLPVCASLSRSMIQQTVGGKTQVASIVSCSILVIVLLWIGPFFEKLPRCVLAAIIIIALKGMLMQVTSVYSFYKLSRVDALVWILTFLTVVIIDIDVGLLVGLLASFVTLMMKGLTPYTCLLGVIPGTDLYVDIKRHKRAQELTGLKIYHYAGGLSYAQCRSFKQELFFKIRCDPIKVFESRINEIKRGQSSSRKMKRNEIITLMENDHMQYYEDSSQVPMTFLIWDLTAVDYIDPAGVAQLRQLAINFEKIHVIVFVVTTSGPLFEMVKKCDDFEHQMSVFCIFPTVHDAVLYAQQLAISTMSEFVPR